MTTTPKIEVREKHFETDVRSDNEYSDLPSKAQFSISEADAIEILRLSNLVKENDLYKVERFDYRTSWLEGDTSDTLTEVSVDMQILNVSAIHFWFSACFKHTSDEVLTERQALSELAGWLGDKQAQ